MNGYLRPEADTGERHDFCYQNSENNWAAVLEPSPDLRGER